jgi:hypothetical protein
MLKRCLPVLESRELACMIAACLLLMLAVAGCGRNAYELASVSGRVTLGGKPLANINVTLQPLARSGNRGEAGPGSYGVSNADGRFQLKTFDGKSGAVVGTHVVLLAVHDTRPSKSDRIVDSIIPSPLPPKAADGSIRFEVPSGGTDRANFDF